MLKLVNRFNRSVASDSGLPVIVGCQWVASDSGVRLNAVLKSMERSFVFDTFRRNNNNEQTNREKR